MARHDPNEGLEPPCHLDSNSLICNRKNRDSGDDLVKRFNQFPVTLGIGFALLTKGVDRRKIPLQSGGVTFDSVGDW
jgi:hypothetical protein